MRKIVASGVLLAAALLQAAARNFSGKWAIRREAAEGIRGGTTILTLNQVGAEVRGTIAAPVEPWTNSPLNIGIWSGKADGNTVSFYIWTGTDQPAKARYRGTMSASGDEIVFTVTGGASPGSVTARRVR